MLRVLFAVVIMWLTRNHHRDDYDYMIDDYEEAKKLGLL
jgi:hypothetical protein